MIAFEITINGQQRIVAATTPNKTLAVCLTWTSRDADQMRLNIGGITEEILKHFDWDVPEPKVGDEISIRIVEADEADQPDRIYQPTLSPDCK